MAFTYGDAFFVDGKLVHYPERQTLLLRLEAESQPLLRTTSNVDAVADIAFGSPRSLSSTRQHRPVTIMAL